nr:retrovirus-related Pol polyprotein from transposon TNT 1-94 [Tanacetum cinerariifolium]
MHNNIMATGSRDRPPMLAPGRYPQWRSRFLRYVDTRPNGEALRKCILGGPYKPTTVLVHAVEATDSPAVPEHTTLETPSNISSSNSKNKNSDTTPRYKNDDHSGQFRTQRMVNVAGTREKVGIHVVYKSGIQCFNCKEYVHFAKECRKPKRVKDSAYHKEKMLLCKQAEQGVPLQAEQYDWLADTDEEVDEQELEAHYRYMAKIQEVPNADSGTYSEPLEHVQNETGYNVFANHLQHSEQSESVSNTCLVEMDDINVTPNSPDMCEDDIQNEQNDVKSDDEHAALANLKLDVDENKKIQKQLKKANTTLAQELKECKVILAETSKSLGESISVRDSCLVAFQTKQIEFEKYKAFNDCTIDYDKLEPKKAISNTNVLRPGMYRIGNRTTHTRAPQLPQNVRNTNLRVSTSTGVNHKPNVSRPQLKSNQSRDKVLPNNSQVEVKKTQVEVHPRIPSISNKIKSVTACKDSLNSRTLNANVVFVTYNKCLVYSNHFACVTKMLNDVHARTKKPTVVPISTRKPKRQANKSIATPHKKKLASKSTNQKPHSYFRVLYENTDKAWKWWIERQSPLGYKWVPKPKKQWFLRVYYVEGLNYNLFSVGQFCDANLEGAFRKSTCFVRDLQGNDLLTGNRGSDLYTISLQESTSLTSLCLMAKATPTQAWLWHRRLSHLNFDYINLLSKKDIVIGLPKLKYVKDQLCSSCELSKAKRSSFKSKVVPSSKERLNLLHMDLCGPMRVASINGKKYILVIVDDYSRYTWTLLLRSKDETPKVLKDFLTMIQRNLQASVITVRTDRGTKTLNKTLSAFLKEEGIKHQTSTARTPEQNGVVERRNHKMKKKGDQCILVGYSTQSKGYHVYNKRTRMIVESIHIRFDEIKDVSKTSVANNTSGLVPQRQKTSDYDNPDPVPQQQDVSSSADAGVPSQQELTLLFGPLYDEFSNAGSNPSTNNQSTSAPSTHTNVHAEENNNDQAEEGEQLQDDEFTNPFCPPAQEEAESSSHNNGNSNAPTFNQPHVFEYRWTKDHPLEQVRGNPSRPVQTRRQLVTDPEMCMFALTVSTAKPKNIKEAMADSAWIEAMQEELHRFDRL